MFEGGGERDTEGNNIITIESQRNRRSFNESGTLKENMTDMRRGQPEDKRGLIITDSGNNSIRRDIVLGIMINWD